MNKTIFVSRHQGAIDWVKDQSMEITHFVTHLSPDLPLVKGDVVVGTLPINIAAELNRNGVRYIHLSLIVTPEMRGKELTKDDMNAAQVNLREFSIEGLVNEG